MNSSLLKPIRRRTYVIGVIIQYIVGFVIGSSAIISLGVNSPSTVNAWRTHVLPSVILLSLVRIVWDYKRIKDISVESYYILLLLIPIVTTAMSLYISFSKTILISVKNAQPGTLPLIVIIFLIFNTLNFIFLLYLIFKEGNIGKTSTPVQILSEVV